MKTRKHYQKVLAEIGSRLAEMRERKGFSTIREFAHRYDLPEIQYWRMEKGKANITLKSLVRILSIHNVSVQDFFCLITEEQE